MKVLGSALFSAVEAGDIDYLRGVFDSCTEGEIQELLGIRREESAQIQRPSNCRDIYVRSPTPLMVAVTEGQDEVLEYMASYKVSKNYTFSIIIELITLWYYIVIYVRPPTPPPLDGGRNGRPGWGTGVHG